MAVMEGYQSITSFDQWYVDYDPVGRRGDGCLEFRGLKPVATHLWRKYDGFKREADLRLGRYEPFELLADAQVTSHKPDLPNISSGETAGLVRRTARSLVQNTPNVEIISKFDDDSAEGIFARHILLSKIIGSDQYSNDMQQNLFASTKMSFTLGFDAVVPALLQDHTGSWYMKYDTIHYRDVFADPGCKDVRSSSSVFVRRFLTRDEVCQLIETDAVGWDKAALKTLLKQAVPKRKVEDNPLQHAKHHVHPEGYEIITWYSNTGENFLTFNESDKMLLRIEKNKDPLHRHPVFFLVLEQDSLQPYGKSQVELIYGRQDFQDLMLNGAMKLWYRNINPSIIGYGTTNAIPNLSPGKFTQIGNPQARIEPFEVNTSTLMQYGTISQQNYGSMLGLVGTPDQQTASQGVYDTLSATPQGVMQQGQIVDVTTNNFQKAIEGFFSHYCSYALTVYFHELRAMKSVIPNAETRAKLLRAGFPEDRFKEDGSLDIDFSKLATEYYVRCVPGSLVEMEDEKQMRMLNELFVPLSQSMSGLAATGNQELINNAAKAMQFIVNKQIQLSGSSFADDLSHVWMHGDVAAAEATDAKVAAVEAAITERSEAYDIELETMGQVMMQMQDQITQLIKTQTALLEKLGGSNPGSTMQPNTSQPPALTAVEEPTNVVPASA